MSDTRDRYGRLTRWLHWGMALLVIWQFLKLGDRINDGEHWIGQTLVPWHISIGVALLVLALIRVLWAMKQSPNRPQHTGSTAPLVKGGHFLLYVVMLLVPITGALLMVGNGYGLEAFGIQLVAESEAEIAWMANIGSLHSPIAILFVALVVGHVCAALYHHFVVRDDTLKRMTS
ncbi:MAG TPA: cytochrome b [Paenalcaligenes sp.]|nr:cytochrome b [Paenalcaligenes sp.]